MLSNLYQRFREQSRAKEKPVKQVLFIFGCQRSGTSVTLRSLGKLPEAMSYPEINSDLSTKDTSELPRHTIRLDPLQDVKSVLERNPSRLIVVKPLVESQRAKEILEYFPQSKALWIYRDYADAVHSMAEKWGRDFGVEHLLPVLKNDPDNWRSESLSDSVLEDIQHAADKGINGHDGWGLFWYARNSLYFDQLLANEPQMSLLKYENMVSDERYLPNALRRVGMPYYAAVVESATKFHRSSIGKGRDVEFSPHVRALLDSMSERLDLVEAN